MSVDIAGNPWKFAQDGTGTNPIGFLYPNAWDCRNLNITKMASVGDRILLEDSSGRQIVDFTATAGEQSFRIGNLGILYGLNIVQFDSGEVTIAV